MEKRDEYLRIPDYQEVRRISMPSAIGGGAIIIGFCRARPRQCAAVRHRRV